MRIPLAAEWGRSDCHLIVQQTLYSNLSIWHARHTAALGSPLMSNMSGGGPGTPPGFYQDAQGTMRWWNGSQWTEQVQQQGGPPPTAQYAQPVPPPDAKEPWYKKKRWWVVAAVFVIIAIAAGGGSGGEDDSGTDDTSAAAESESPTTEDQAKPDKKKTKQPEPEPEPEPEGMPVDAGTILREFEENELAADSKYKGETLLITGIVDNIDTELFDDEAYVLRLKGGRGFAMLTLNCNDMSTDELATINVGEEVTVLGEFDDGGDLGVEVKDCELA
jgi:hypothetical protein